MESNRPEDVAERVESSRGKNCGTLKMPTSAGGWQAMIRTVHIDRTMIGHVEH